MTSHRWAWTPPPPLSDKKSGSAHALSIQQLNPPPPPPPPGSPNVRRNYMVMSVPWLNYPLTIEALTGGGWNKLACSPKIENLFSWVPCSPTFSLFACPPQKLHLPPLFPWNKCPFTLFPKTHGRPHQLLTYTPPSILLLLLCLLFS